MARAPPCLPMPRAADAAAAQQASGDEEEAESLVTGASLDETATVPVVVVPEDQHAVNKVSIEG